VKTIEEWWPGLSEPVRDWIVNNYFSPLAPYTLKEIERMGGPSVNDPYWETESDGGRYLPPDAVQWVLRSPDHARSSRPHEPDPRAAYFERRGTWPWKSSSHW